MSKLIVCWDSSCIISYVTQDAARFAELDHWIKLTGQDKVGIMCSAVCVTECRKLGQSSDITPFDKFFNTKNIEVVPVTRFISRQAALIANDVGMNTCDAIILATSIHTKSISELHTYDSHFISLGSLIIQKYNMKACQPTITNPSLFLS